MDEGSPRGDVAARQLINNIICVGRCVVALLPIDRETWQRSASSGGTSEIGRGGRNSFECEFVVVTRRYGGHGEEIHDGVWEIEKVNEHHRRPDSADKRE